MVNEYGRDWSDECPRGAIDWLMGNTHVGTPDAEIRAMIRERAIKSRDKGETRWTEEAIKEAEDYAIASMEANRDLCRAFRL